MDLKLTQKSHVANNIGSSEWDRCYRRCATDNYYQFGCANINGVYVDLLDKFFGKLLCATNTDLGYPFFKEC